MPTVLGGNLLFRSGGRSDSYGTVLAQPTFGGAGWATFGLPLAPGDLPSGQSLKVGALDTQTDVKTTWGDGSAKFAVVTCEPTGAGSLDVIKGTPAGGSFTPTVPTASVVFTVYDRFTLIGDFSITSGTLNVVLRNAAGSATKMAADAILIEALDGSGVPTGTNYVVDNADGSPAYVESGTWGDGGNGYQSGLNHGYANSERITSDSAATATWQKTGLASGVYRISACWAAQWNEGGSCASCKKCGYEVFDGAASRGELFFSQFWDSGEVGGTTLGDFSITSGTCNVRLGNDCDGNWVFGERVALYLGGELIAVQGYNDAGVSLSGFAASSGYAAVGDANNSDTVYYSAAAGGGTNYVQFQFTGLASGTYRIVVWQLWGRGNDTSTGSSAYDNGVYGLLMPTDAPWTVLDNATNRGTVDVDMQDWSGRQKATTYTATLSAAVGSDLWMDGALCKEWRRYQNPQTAGAVAHPALLVIWDVRCFDDGTARVQVAVENSYNKARVKEVYYDAVVTINGSSVFTVTTQEHFAACRWTKVFAAASWAESTVAPDFTRAVSSEAKLLPEYLPSTGNWTTDVSVTNRWTILHPGGIDQYDMYTGSVNYVGPYPLWVSGFLVHKGSAAKNYMMETARNSVAAYPVHFRNPADNTILDPETNTAFWPDGRSSPNSVSVDYDAIRRCRWRWFLAADQSHHPQAALVPYLFSGDRCLADEMAHWLTYEIVASNNRIGASMILEATEARGAGWSLRTVAENTAFLPNAHEAAAWGAISVANTAQWHDDYAAGSVKYLPQDRFLSATSPVAYMDFVAGNGADITGGLYPQISANWQNIYILYSLQRARDLGLASSSLAENAVDRITAYSLGIFGGQQTPGSESDPAISNYPRDANTMKLITEGFAATCSDDSNYFKNWTVAVGTAGTHVVVGSVAESYGQLGCLKLVSDGSTLASVYQEFNKANSNLANQGGTAETLSTSTNYYLVTWMKISSTDSAGTVVLELVDGSGSVINSNQFTVNVADLITSYVRKVFTIAVGGSLAGVYRLRIRFGSSPTSGRSVFLGPVTVYQVPGGTRVNSTGFYTSVGFNNAGSIAYAATWDGLYAAAVSGGNASAMPWPNENNWAEHALCLNISERLGLAGAADAYDVCVNHANFVNRDNFNFVRGMYAP